MKRYRVYLFDLDGTLYRGSEAVPYAAETLATLRNDGAALRFLTNNSGATPVGVSEKLNAMGIEAHPAEVATSGMAAATFLRSQGLDNLFVIGEPGLIHVLREAELTVLNMGSDGRVCPHPPESAQAVVCGICRTFTYALLDAALQQIRGGAHFIATNPDATYPMEGGRLQPGAGSLVAAVQTCSGVTPRLVGKPAPAMVHLALESTGLGVDDAVLVGDRVDTDLGAAEAAGCHAVLVLTGVTEEAPPGRTAIADLRGLLR